MSEREKSIISSRVMQLACSGKYSREQILAELKKVVSDKNERNEILMRARNSVKSYQYRDLRY